MKNLIKNKYTKLSIAAVIGSLLGFAYYYYVGCATGTCPITSNPYISTAYGAVLGLIYAFPSKKKKQEESENESN